jgi:hypothetical protein
MVGEEILRTKTNKDSIQKKEEEKEEKLFYLR